MIKAKKKRVGDFIIQLNQHLSANFVYSAYQEKTQQPAIVKMFPKQLFDEDQYTLRAFLIQLKILRHLKSRNLLKVLACYESRNNYYYFMEYANEGTLRKYLRQNKKFCEKQALSLIKQILNGMGQLLFNGISHKNLRPQKILIKDGYLKIANFGLSIESDNNSFMRTFANNLIYMSPQIMMSQKFTIKCDIWSIGVIFYQLLVGKHPFILKYKNIIESIKDSYPIQFPQQLNININIQNFIKKCLEFQEINRIDWQNLYADQIFQGIYGSNLAQFDVKKLNLRTFFTQFRINVNSQNINVHKLLDLLPQRISLERFGMILQSINPKLENQQIEQVYQWCRDKGKLSKQQLIRRQEFFQLINKCQIYPRDSNKNQQKSNEDHQKTQILNPNYVLFQKLRKKIDQKRLNLDQAYEPFFEKLNQRQIELHQFIELIKKIDDQLSNQEMKILFGQFDLNKQAKISFEVFLRTIYKIAEVIRIPKKK